MTICNVPIYLERITKNYHIKNENICDYNRNECIFIRHIRDVNGILIGLEERLNLKFHHSQNRIIR